MKKYFLWAFKKEKKHTFSGALGLEFGKCYREMGLWLGCHSFVHFWPSVLHIWWFFKCAEGSRAWQTKKKFLILNWNPKFCLAKSIDAIPGTNFFLFPLPYPSLFAKVPSPKRKIHKYVLKLFLMEEFLTFKSKTKVFFYVIFIDLRLRKIQISDM